MKREKITNSQVTVNQHVVPQSHLKKFKILSQTQQKLECFNVDALRVEKPQSTNSICSGDFHYAQNVGIYDDYSQVVEEAFGSIENWYSKNMERIEQGLLKGVTLSSSDRYGIAWVICNFYFRGFKFRDETQRGITEVLDWLRPNFVQDVEEGLIEMRTKLTEAEKEGLISHTVDSFLQSYIKNTSFSTNRSFDKEIVNLLTNKKWHILINDAEKYSFVTGDEAVIEIEDSAYSKDFILARGFPLRTQIFHLSPRIAIIASFPKNKKEEGRTEFEDVTDNKAKIFKNNLYYVNHTYKYCYGPEKTFFEEVIAFEKTGAIPKIF